MKAERGQWGTIKGTGESYSYLKVYHLLNESAHLIVEAEPVFSLLFRGKDKVTLTFLLALHDNPVTGPHNTVVNIEGAA